jgi:hypothetical protein
MQKEITLTVSKQLIINQSGKTFTRSDLAKAVAYWRHIIDGINDPRPIAICFGSGSTTFQTVAVLLAIIDSGRNYYKFDQLAPGAKLETIKYPKIEGGVSVTFIAGKVQAEFDYSVDPDIFEVESDENLARSLANDQAHDLTITFKFGQKRYNNTSGTTSGYPKLIEASVGSDGYSVKAAMDSYIKDNDHCAFLHNMSHIGVHTTAILPSIFKAKEVTFVSSDNPDEWSAATRVATHTQYFYTMLDWYKLPSNTTIRTISTGGDYLKPRMIEELLKNTAVEKIVDIYGLTEAAPPLAIREVADFDDLSKPFMWINSAYKCYLDENDTAVVIRPDGVHWKSNDLAKWNEYRKEFHYVGRYGATNKIRMLGLLFSGTEFRQSLEDKTGIVNYFLDLSNSTMPKLIITDADRSSVEQFIKDVDAVVELSVVETLSTNGGIKNIS